LVYATEGGLFFRDKDIHGRKNPHECGGTLPAWLFCIGVLVFKGVCYSVARSGEKEERGLFKKRKKSIFSFLKKI
jgi:hypothetical protein